MSIFKWFKSRTLVESVQTEELVKVELPNASIKDDIVPQSISLASEPVEKVTVQSVQQIIQDLVASKKQLDDCLIKARLLLPTIEKAAIELFKLEQPLLYQMCIDAGVKLPIVVDTVKHAKYVEEYKRKANDYTRKFTGYSLLLDGDIKSLRNSTIPNILEDVSENIKGFVNNAQHFEIFLDGDIPYTIVNKVRYDFTDARFRKLFLNDEERGVVPEASYILWQQFKDIEDIEDDPNYVPFDYASVSGNTLWFTKDKSKKASSQRKKNVKPKKKTVKKVLKKK